MDVKQIISVGAIAAIVSLGVQTFDHSGNANGATMTLTKTSELSTAQRVLREGSIRCAYIAYPPYFDFDLSTGEPKGLNVDLMNTVGKKLGLEIEWTEEVGWGSLVEGLAANRYDAVCSAVWQNTTRAIHANFSQPYGYAAVDAYVRPDDNRFDHNVNRLNQPDVVFSAIDGEASEVIYRDLFSNAKRISIPQTAPVTDMLMNVVTGKADVVLVEPKFAKDFLAANPNSLRKVTLGQPIATFPLALVLPKGDEHFKFMIDAALSEILLSPMMRTILAQHDLHESELMLPAKPF